MYINPFVAGVLATVLLEFVVITVVTIVYNTRRK